MVLSLLYFLETMSIPIFATFCVETIFPVEHTLAASIKML